MWLKNEQTNKKKHNSDDVNLGSDMKECGREGECDQNMWHRERADRTSGRSLKHFINKTLRIQIKNDKNHNLTKNSLKKKTIITKSLTNKQTKRSLVCRIISLNVRWDMRGADDDDDDDMFHELWSAPVVFNHGPLFVRQMCTCGLCVCCVRR